MKYDFLFGDLKLILASRYGRADAKRIIKNAEEEYKRLEVTYPDVKGDGKVMLPFAAYYIAIREHDPKNALKLLCRYGTHLGKKFRKIIHGATSLPFVSRAIWRNMPKLLENASSEEKGYTANIINEGEVMGVDILSCPINDAAAAMGIPEAAKIICAMDKEYMNGIKNIVYKRKYSVAEGGKCCDYRLSFDRYKK